MITCPTDKLQKVLLSGGCEQNGTPTPTVPIDIVCNNGALKVSRNLFDKNNLPERINAYFESSGTTWAYAELGYSVRIPCLPNTTYTVRYNGNSEQAVLSFASTNNDNIPALSAKFITVTQAIRQNSPTINTPITITTANDDKWLIVQYNAEETQNADMANNLQIEVGSVATPYMPYGQVYTEGTQEVVTDNLGNTANAERLLAVGNYKDTQSVLDGSVTRNVGIKVFDGTENWSYYGKVDGGNLYYTENSITDNKIGVTGLALYCSHAVPTDNSNYWAPGICRFQLTANKTVASSRFYFNSSVSLLDNFKSWLASQYANGNPVIVVYPLAEPTTEQVTPQPLAGNTATVTAGSIDNLPIESSTIAELKKRYIGDKEVEKVYIGENLVYNRNN